jgi:hypothetical protein
MSIQMLPSPGGRRPCPRGTGSTRLAALSCFLLALAVCSFQRRASADPAPIDPLISPELALDVPVQGIAEGAHPAVAFNGALHLVAWVEPQPQGGRFYGARVAADGTVLDPLGIPLFEGGEGSIYAGPAVASDGDDFLVVARACVPGSCTVRGTRVTAAGEVLDSGGITIAADTAGFDPVVVFDRTNYLVAWQHWSNADPSQSGVHVVRVSRGGMVLDPWDAVVLPTTYCGGLRAASGGQNTLLTWIEPLGGGQARLVGARVSPAGVVLDPAGFQISPDFTRWHPYFPCTSTALTFDGTGYMAAWSAWAGYGPQELLVARVTTQGAVLDPAGIFVGTPIEWYTFIDNIAAAQDSGGALLAWGSRDYSEGVPVWSQITTARVSSSGAVSPPSLTLHQGRDLAAAPAAAGAFLAWTRDIDWNGLDTLLYPVAARLDHAGSSLDDPAGIPLSAHANDQEVGGVAFDGERFLVVWVDGRDPQAGGGVFGARVSAAGALLDPEGFLIADTPGGVVHVVFDGQNFLVVLGNCGIGDYGQMQRVRVTSEGVVLDPFPISIPFGMLRCDHIGAAASNGSSTLLVMEQYVDYQTTTLTAMVMDQQGTVGPPHTFAPARDEYLDSPRQPAIAWDGTNYLVVWHDWGGIWGMRLSPQGEPIDAAPFNLATSPSSAYEDLQPVIAFGGSTYLTLWEGDGAIYSARITPQGQVLDPEGFVLAPLDSAQNPFGGCGHWVSGAACPALSFDGTHFVAAWRSTSIPGDLGSINLQAAWVSPSGVALSPFTLSAEQGGEMAPALASNSGGETLAAYTRFLPDASYRAGRALARWIAPAAPSGATASSPTATTPRASYPTPAD